MSANDLESTDCLSLSAHDRLDQACDRFETAWNAGERPQIDEYLADATSSEREMLLRELLILELFWRRRVGERPDPREYAGRFPHPDGIAAIVAAFVRDASTPSRFTNHEFHQRGGLGAVFKAHDEELNRLVALKKIRDDCAHDPHSQARFLREAEITGQLEHPGVVAVYSLNRSGDDGLYYAMRLIRGETLQEAVARFHAANSSMRDPGKSSLDLRGLLQRFIDVCNTVDYAHSRKIIHRDLKPDNVMLGPYGETLVLDWGLAKPLGPTALPDAPEPTHPTARSGGSSDTQPGSFVGTPRFMSPEQAAGQHESVGPASDIYSLGATLYNLLTGRPPFLDDHDVAVILEKVKAGAFVPPRSLRPDIPTPLEAICLKAMSRRPEDRYGNARALAGDVEHWLADEPASALPESLPQRLGRWMRRHRRSTQVAAAASVVIAAMAVVSAILIDRARRGEQAALRSAKEALAAETKAKSEAETERARTEDRERLAIDAMRRFRDVATGDDLLKSREDLKPLLNKLLQEPLAFFNALRGHLQSSLDTRTETLERLAHASFDLGVTTYQIGNKTDALRALEDALAIWEWLARENPSDTEFQSDLHQVLAYTGSLQELTGRAAAAIESYRKALVTAQRLARDNPSVTSYQGNVAWSHRAIGKVEAATGRRNEAIESLRKAIVIQERLTRDQPSTAQARSELAQSLYSVANLEAVTGRPNEAIESFRKVLVMRERLVCDDPSNAQFRGELAWSHYALGNMQAVTGRPAEAIESYERAMVIQEPLARENPSNVWFQRDLAVTQGGLGNAQRDTRKPVAAFGSLQKALAIQDRLVHENPSVTQFQDDLAGSHNDIGVLLQATGQPTEALQSHRSALALRERLARENPLNTELQSNLAASLGHFRDCQKLIELDAKLAPILRGEAKPKDEEEAVALATLCSRKSLHGAAARLFQEAFETPTGNTDRFQSGRRYAAASAAALAGCGKGKDGPSAEPALGVWRAKAREWLRADLVALDKLLEHDSPQGRGQVQTTLASWKADNDLAGLRDEPELGKMPESEQRACRTFWADVEALLRKAGSAAPTVTTQAGHM
jgi:eukaryotic-like serine/threonine-protein kinase